VEPPKWNMPSCSPFAIRCPGCTVTSQLDTSAMPTGTTHIRPILGLSASMKMSARVATAVRKGWDWFRGAGVGPHRAVETLVAVGW
jgi:hypothetical protein